MMRVRRAFLSSGLAGLILAGVGFAPAWAADNELTPEERRTGWQLLFDGKTTRGWHSFRKTTFPETGWTAEGGVLKLAAQSKAGDILSDRTFAEFDLSWEWRIPKGANNGIKYFVLETRPQPLGHEYQMIDDAAEKLDPKHSTGSFYDVLPPVSDAPRKPAGEWNQSRIRVQGQRVEHWLNGTKILEYEMGSESLRAALAKSKFHSVAGFGERHSGSIMLTYHSDPVEYKNIKIKDLSSK